MPKLGHSFFQAKTRYLNAERSFQGNVKGWALYCEFMQEMLDMKHMELVPDCDLDVPPEKCFYLPHHGVVKESSTTTKFRLVFDGSAKTSSGRSLNDNLLVGPKKQDDLFHITLRFRLHEVALTADITKMYRMVKLTKASSDFQRILFRFTPEGPIQTYRIIVVIYGTANAAYHSVRTLVDTAKLAPDEMTRLTIQEDFYVDDCVTGAATVEEAVELLKNVAGTVAKVGFELRKWACSVPSVVNQLPEHLRESKDAFELGKDDPDEGSVSLQGQAPG